MTDTLYRARSFAHYALGRDLAAVTLGDDAPPRVVPADVARALETLKGFAPIEVHAARAAAMLRGPERAALARRLLDELAASSSLVSNRAVAQALVDGSARVDPPCAIRTLVVPTCDRLESLGRSLEAFTAHAARGGRAMRVVVTDDSPGAPARLAARELLRRVCATHGATGAYVGLEEKERHAARLASESGVALPVVRFGLLGDPACGMTTGANRNAALLATVDEPALWFDDDVEPQCAAPPRRLEGAAFGADGEASEVHFYADRDAVLASVVREEHDLIAVHERWLGRSLRAVASLAAGPVDISHMTPEMLRDVLADRGRVVTTITGVYGDSGMSSSASLIVGLSGRSRAEFLSSPEAYGMALTSREWLRGPPRPTILHPYPFMATSFALDPRGGVPPFFPVLRNQDGVFGAVLTRCFDGVYAVQLPVAVLHAADRSRRYKDPFATPRVPLSILVATFVASQPFDLCSGDGAERLEWLGERLRRWGEFSPAEFLAVGRSVVLPMVSSSAAKAQHLIDGPARSVDFWRRDLDRLLEGLQTGVAGDRYAVPVDVEELFGVDAALAKTQELVRDYGALLAAWSVLVGAERRLRERGEGLGMTSG